MSNATNVTRYRRALSAGLSVSAAAHLGALFVLTVPGAGPGESDAPRADNPRTEFDAVQVVRLVAPDPIRPEQAPRVTATTPGGSAAQSEASAPPRLETLLAQMAPASVSVPSTRESRPVVTFSDLEPISEDLTLMAALYDGVFDASGEDEEDEDGGLKGLLSSIGAALSGGGHCPSPATSGGPLILR